ncbi:ATP synthase F1 subunit epsilon [Xanthomonas sp. AmX2]|uniref:ATP synthase F1 subunit epsilon n=1 Tax=Xanthomonas sp. TaxID=29446 RepID=UPI00198232E4|nr:ATP synthase F1 subunit epsilon [Xanthomonas sp.]MBN6150956.1 ATP synthase F1 subunit epsilon [Xanthomonas sp.]
MRLDIISLTGEVWSGEVREVTLPGAAGEFGVLHGHAAMLCGLREGMIHVHPRDGQALEIYVSGGCVEVQPEQVIVMADLAVRDADLDRARAEAARERARAPMAMDFAEEASIAIHAELMHRYSVQLRSGGWR